MTSVLCSTQITKSAPGLLGSDPLQLLGFAESLVDFVTPTYLLVISIALSGIAYLLTLLLFVPAIFQWRHARNVHCFCIATAGGATFFIFITALNVHFGVSGGMSGLSSASLDVIVTQRGVLLEAVLWASFGVWLFAFLFAWFLRWWEILERRKIRSRAR